MFSLINILNCLPYIAKKVQLEEHITKERRKLEEFRKNSGEYDDAMKEDITKRIDSLNDELATRQESINLLKGRLKNQITSFKETIAKVSGKDTSLAEKIRTLFREQGITIASILTAIGMAIGVLVEALLPGGGAAASGGPPPKDEKGLKEWVRSKLKALASLLGRLCINQFQARTSPPRANPRGIFLTWSNSLPPGQEDFTKIRPPGQKTLTKTPPPGKIVYLFNTVIVILD